MPRYRPPHARAMKPGESRMDPMSQVISLKTLQPQEIVAESFLVFSNPGALEMDLVKLLGVSMKESTDPIGTGPCPTCRGQLGER
jgi:hypothetical protein